MLFHESTKTFTPLTFSLFFIDKRKGLSSVSHSKVSLFLAVVIIYKSLGVLNGENPPSPFIFILPLQILR